MSTDKQPLTEYGDFRDQFPSQRQAYLEHSSERKQMAPPLRVRLFAGLQRLVARLFHRHPARGYEGALTFREKVGMLNISQWSYLVAIVILLSSVSSMGNFVSDPSGIFWIAMVAGIGMLRELWHMFDMVWSKTFGKGIILVLYAGTANFALAISALKINAISGVDPEPFIFTMGFTTLLMLPFWLILATLVFFIFAFLIGNLWLVFGTLLKVIGISLPVYWEDRSFAFLTMVMRIILAPLVIFALVNVLEPYAKALDVFEYPVTAFNSSLSPQDEQALSKALGNEVTEKLVVESKVFSIDLGQTEKAETMVLATEPTLDAQSERADDSLESEQTDPFQAEVVTEEFRWLDTLVANFLYHFETYPHSACQKTEKQRALILDELSVFLAERDDSELGYTFSVQACVPVYRDEVPAK